MSTVTDWCFLLLLLCTAKTPHLCREPCVWCRKGIETSMPTAAVHTQWLILPCYCVWCQARQSRACLKQSGQKNIQMFIACPRRKCARTVYEWDFKNHFVLNFREWLLDLVFRFSLHSFFHLLAKVNFQTITTSPGEKSLKTKPGVHIATMPA